MQKFKKLPDLGKLKISTEYKNINPEPDRTEINDKLHKTELALSFLLKNIQDIKQQSSNRVKVVNDYESRISALNKKITHLVTIIRSYQKGLKEIDSGVINKQKNIIEKLNQKLVHAENSLKAYKKNHLLYYDLSKKLAGKNQVLEQENKELKILLNETDKKFQNVRSDFSQRLSHIHSLHEKELSKITQEYMEKELELNSKIDSLKQDLDRYYNIIKENKIKQDRFIVNLTDVLENFDSAKKEKN
ncbi:hypothetical protein JXB41_01360 [Candidatus Woesearchaeota archaeon]|nr:hypothetical protein [Candidatus Woesearchaeota archaeon]